MAKPYKIVAASRVDAAAWHYGGVTGTKTCLGSHQDPVLWQPCRLAGALLSRPGEHHRAGMVC